MSSELFSNIGDFISNHGWEITFGALGAAYTVCHLAAVKLTGDFLRDAGYFSQEMPEERPSPERDLNIHIHVRYSPSRRRHVL